MIAIQEYGGILMMFQNRIKIFASYTSDTELITTISREPKN
jgi:hypothetical protein